jgi:glycosyltransferase involved in cell wall biosynthesis
MKVAIVNTYDLQGGAARAASRLHRALMTVGIDSRLFVQQRSTNESDVVGQSGNWSRAVGRMRWQLDNLPAHAVGAVRGQFSVNFLSGGLSAKLREFQPDVIHLHWVNAAYVSIAEIATLRAPVFWTAHDMWPFTGGCHYDEACGRFAEDRCLPCPLQRSAPAFPLARARLAAKVRASTAASVSFIAPSRWMASVANLSPVGRTRSVAVIPNAIDTHRFKPMDRAAARDLYGLPLDRIIFLFGGVLSDADPRKGFSLLNLALADLAATDIASRVSICIFGSDGKGEGLIHGMPVRYIGHLHDDESLVALYSACDVFLAPSLQDNLPNTVMEASSCGRPTVAFDIGGMSDLIDHGISGWLAKGGDIAAFAEGMIGLARNAEFRASAGIAARDRSVARFSYTTVAASHVEAYRLGLRASSKST